MILEQTFPSENVFTPPVWSTNAALRRQQLQHAAAVNHGSGAVMPVMTSVAIRGVHTVQQRDDGSRQSGDHPVRPPAAGERDRVFIYGAAAGRVPPVTCSWTPGDHHW